MIEFSMPGSVLMYIVIILGAIMVISNTKDGIGATLLGATGVMLITVGASLLAGTSIMATKFGIPIEVRNLKHFHEFRLEKRLNPSLSLVKKNDGNDERIVKDIPAHMREGDIFMIKEDNSVVIIKSLPKH